MLVYTSVPCFTLRRPSVLLQAQLYPFYSEETTGSEAGGHEKRKTLSVPLLILIAVSGWLTARNSGISNQNTTKELHSPFSETTQTRQLQ